LVALMKTTNILGADARERALLRMVYDRLGYLDRNLNVVPWALESWKKVDNRTWDVKLRGGMTFHDGKPVTVDDLKFTFDFLCKYDRAEFWTANQFLEKTEILDQANRVVRFTFKGPFGQFETLFLLINVILPKHIFDGILEKQNVTNPRHLQISEPIGSGPFKWGQYKKDAELLLVANKQHFNAPKVDEVMFICIPSADGIMGRLETKELDYMDTGDMSLTPSQAEQLKKQKHLRIVRTADFGWYHLVPMISQLPWRDIEFRRAWHHTIDRKFLVDVVWEGGGRIPTSNTFLVEGSPFYNPKLPEIPKFDLKLAREILRGAGYSWDKEGRLVYPPPTDKKFIERVNRVCKPGYTWGGLKMQPSG
jgi:peptide/nickel transport system substrate-binding protein